MVVAAASFEEPLVALRRQIEELEALPEGGRDKELERLRAALRRETAEVFAGILSLLVLVLGMNAAVTALERAWLGWAPRAASRLW